MNKNEIDETLEELEKMSDNVLVLNDAYSKENPLLLELANITYYLLWNYTKSLIALKMYLNSTFRCEKDFALSQICITINECLKHVIGFNTKDSKQRKDSIWIAKMGRFIVCHPEMQEHYNSLKEKLLLFADKFDKGSVLKAVRDIATHGDKDIEKMRSLHQIPSSTIIQHLSEWGMYMQPTAHFAFTVFENECQREIDNRNVMNPVSL